MSLVHAVEVPRRPVARLEPIIGAARYARLARAADWLRQVLAGRAVWCVSSAAAGGGVAEMLQTLVGYAQGLDVPVGWLVISGDVGFFAITKRLHNQMHGNPAGGPFSAAEAGHYRVDAGRERRGTARPGPVMRCCCTTRRPPGWPRRWRRQAPGWCGTATSASSGKTT